MIASFYGVTFALSILRLSYPGVVARKPPIGLIHLGGQSGVFWVTAVF